MWVRLSGKMVNGFRLLALQKLGEICFVSLNEVARLNAHGLVKVCQVGWPSARYRDAHNQVTLGDEVFAEIASYEP